MNLGCNQVASHSPTVSERPQEDSNLQPSASEAAALSIEPQGRRVLARQRDSAPDLHYSSTRTLGLSRHVLGPLERWLLSSGSKHYPPYMVGVLPVRTAIRMASVTYSGNPIPLSWLGCLGTPGRTRTFTPRFRRPWCNPVVRCVGQVGVEPTIPCL